MMVEPIKSALFVDYESLHRSLTGGETRGDTRLADRAVAWVAAIESGRLIGPEGKPRRLVAKRVYASPNVRGKQRDALAAAGFEVIDFGADNGVRSSADLHMAMDTIDALGRPNGPDEFILLSGTFELAPLLTRLKASKRSTAIYADRRTSDSDRALADSVLDGTDFAAFLASEENPASPAAENGTASDRADIEAFARKIHAATNIPLFSPKTFAELFRFLTEEIRQNGYHFQTTAKNVAEQMAAAGRNVARRQVVFIVKGLALKGHVFSTSDTPESLAEVFREQAHYLITNAGITLDEKQEGLLSAWFMSRPPVPAKRPAAPAAKAQPEPSPAPVEAAPPMPAMRPPAKAKPPLPRPTASARPVVRPVELPKSAARPTPAPKPVPQPDAREEAKAVIAARIAASAKLKPGAKTAQKTPPQAPPRHAIEAPAPPPPAARAARPALPTRAPQRTPQQSDAFEDSILAAIAEAVDVLVEDGSAEPLEPAEPAARQKADADHGQRPPEPVDDEEEGESGDIGDQIQRIIASYSRNRSN